MAAYSWEERGEGKHLESISELKVLAKAIEIVSYGNSCSGSVKFCVPPHILQLHSIPKLLLFWPFLTNPLVSPTLL